MSSNPNKPKDERRLSRHSPPSTGRKKRSSGWQVRFQSRIDKSKRFTEFFNDNKYGGPEKSKEAAIKFRDAIEKEIKEDKSSFQLNKKSKNRNVSGIIGVHKTICTDKKKYGTYKYEYWQAHYPISRNKNKSVKFSINKYGDKDAKRLAIEAREKGLALYQKKEFEEKQKSELLFIQPQDINIKIWRYMDFTKFVSLLVNTGLFFPVAKKFNDQFEGSYSFVNKKMRPLIYKHLKKDHSIEQVSLFLKELRKWVCINCWHINEIESAGMWSLYSKTSESICIQSTYTKLRSSLDDEIKIGVVQYTDYNKEWITETDLLAPFLYKRKSFEHERELRAIINLSNPLSTSKLKFVGIPPVDGKWINLDLKNLIEKVYVSPNTTNWFYELVQNVVDVYKLNVSVVRSSLEEEPFF